MGGCQNYGPFLGTLDIRGGIIIGTQKWTIILTTTHIDIYTYLLTWPDGFLAKCLAAVPGPSGTGFARGGLPQAFNKTCWPLRWDPYNRDYSSLGYPKP